MTKKGNWVIIGRHTVLEALEDGQTIDKVMLDRLANFPDVVEKCKKYEVPIQKVPREKLDKFGTNHQGVAAFRSQVEYTDLEALVPHLFETGSVPVLMILDRVTDVGNFGSITRSAEVLGADGIVFPVRESAQINADAVKRSAGALLRIPLCRVRDLVTAARFLKDSGFTVIAADEKGRTPINEVDLKQPIAIITMPSIKRPTLMFRLRVTGVSCVTSGADSMPDRCMRSDGGRIDPAQTSPG